MEDPAEYVRSRLYEAWTIYEVTATVQASAERVQEKLGGWGEATPVNEHSCAVRVPASDRDWTTFALATLQGLAAKEAYVSSCSVLLLAILGGRYRCSCFELPRGVGSVLPSRAPSEHY